MTWTSALVILLVLALLAVVTILVCERGRFVLPSTLKSMGARGLRETLSLKGLHGYVYGRWPAQYIKVLIDYLFPRLGDSGRQWVADRYHGKVLLTDHARAIVQLDHDIPRQDLEQIVPFPMARDLVLSGPPDIAVFDCPCRLRKPNPCQPVQVCMIFGSPFVDFMIEHHPHSSRRLSQGEALELLDQAHERGHVHSAWFKDVCMNQFFVLCNCCKCCCVGLDTMARYGTQIVASSGFVARVDEDRCSACGTCESICPFEAIHVDNVATVNWEKCMGCGVCVDQCPSDALSLDRDGRKGAPLDVRLLHGGASEGTP